MGPSKGALRALGRKEERNHAQALPGRQSPFLNLSFPFCRMGMVLTPDPKAGWKPRTPVLEILESLPPSPPLPPLPTLEGEA